ncbi:MAG: AraD1 family protein [Eudoraea sp.]
MRLVQLNHPTKGRFIALVEEPNLRLISTFNSVYTLALKAIEENGEITSLIKVNLSEALLSYDKVYNDLSEYKLLAPFDHPQGPLQLMLAGTGLTHKASAENRQKMHDALEEKELTDSMKIYLMGVEKGHPDPGEIGVQPEWFYKGNGSILCAHNEVLEVPSYGDDGGEEPEVAGVYIVNQKGIPYRIGFTTANEFSDHLMERKNYLYLAPSKIRNCSLGPELVITDNFKNISGRVSVERNAKIFWEKSIKTGEANMSHSIENLEYHHFKYNNHKIPGTAHIHFFGADAFSFGEGISLKNNDLMEVSWEGFGRPLRNTIKINREKEEMFSIENLR